jgi:hypothetical protein
MHIPTSYEDGLGSDGKTARRGCGTIGHLTAASSQPGANLSTDQISFDLSRLSKENRVRFRDATGRMVVAARLGQLYALNLYALTWGMLAGEHG